MLKSIFLIGAIVFGTSCGVVRTVGINTTAGLLKDGANEVNTEANFSVFEKAMPSNLKILEGLWFTKQDNEDLLSLLIKGHGGVGFGVWETYYLDDKLKGLDESYSKKMALYHYTKAFDYGLRYFQENGISQQELFDKEAAVKLPERLKSKFSNDDMIAAFYFAQSWGSMINLQKDNVELISQLGTVKAIMDWVCERDPEFENGSCMMFYAMYEAGRPAMLGGNLENGNKLFRKYISTYPQNLLARLSYIQYYIVPMMDEELYALQKEKLIKEFKAWRGVLNYADRSEGTVKYLEKKEFNLFNSIAEKRFQIIEKYAKDIF